MQNKLKLFVFTVAVCCVIATVNSNVINDIRLSGDEYDDSYYAEVPVYTPSRECSLAGGLCVQEQDCAAGQTTFQKGLCPDKDLGVECCYQVNPRPAPCAQLGGECMKWCSPSLRTSNSNNCASDEYCCVLV